MFKKNQKEGREKREEGEGAGKEFPILRCAGKTRRTHPCTKRSMVPKATGVAVCPQGARSPALGASLSLKGPQTNRSVFSRGQKERFLPRPTRNSGFNVEERSWRDPNGCLQMWGGPRGVKTVRPRPHVLTRRTGTRAAGAWCFSGP